MKIMRGESWCDVAYTINGKKIMQGQTGSVAFTVDYT